MGTTSKVCHVILRVWEIICSVIVLGLVAHFVNRINSAGVGNDSRVIYTLVDAVHKVGHQPEHDDGADYLPHPENDMAHL